MWDEKLINLLYMKKSKMNIDRRNQSFYWLHILMGMREIYFFMKAANRFRFELIELIKIVNCLNKFPSKKRPSINRLFKFVIPIKN